MVQWLTPHSKTVEGSNSSSFGLSERSLRVHSKLTTGASESGRLSLC